MKDINSIEDTNKAELESDAEKKKKTSTESSIFSTILADIEQNPTVLQKPKRLSVEFSVISTILVDFDEDNPKSKKIQRRGSMKTPIDFTSTESSQTLTCSDLVNNFSQELNILKSELEINGQARDRSVPCNSDYDRECDCVEEGKVEQREEVKLLVDEVTESEIYRCSTNAEDSVRKVEDGKYLEGLDEMLSTMLGDEDEQVNSTEDCGRVGEFFEEMLQEVEKDGTYLERIKDCYVFGGLLESLLRERLRKKAENEICSCISNKEPEVNKKVAEEQKEEKRDIKETNEMTSMEVKMERTQQESIVTKGDCVGYEKWLDLFEKAREQHENLIKRKRKAMRFGMELSFLVAELMFLIPNKILATENKDYSVCTKLFGINEDDEGICKLMEKLDVVVRIVIWKKANKEHDVNLPESIFRYDDIFHLCADAIRVLGKIVSALQTNQCGGLKLSDLDSLFEDCQKVLMKIELKLAEMKQCIYRSVSADYESFSKSERFDRFLREKIMKKINADNRFTRSVIGPYLVKIWNPLSLEKALQEQ